MTITRKITLPGLLMLAAINSAPLWAADNMTFRGTLIEPPPCVVKNAQDGATVTADFGQRVGVNKVDGQAYKQTLDYKVVCGPDASGLSVSLILKGNAAGFDSAAVPTREQPDLAIRLLLNSKPFTLNKEFSIDDPKNPPTLEAVPVKKPGATLKEGAFNASVTLQAVYQ